MTQVLFYSIQSEPIANILNGLKTIEVRKRDLPQWAKDKLAKGEDVWGYGYCTKGKPIVARYESVPQVTGWGTVGVSDYLYEITDKTDKLAKYFINGRVVVKFRVSGTTKYVDCSDCTNTENGYECENDFMYLLSDDPILRKATCLEADEIEEYGNGADLYAHHFTNIQPVNMELGEFYKTIHYPKTSEYMTPHICEYKNVLKCYQGNQDDCLKSFELTKAPQSFQTVWVKGE